MININKLRHLAKLAKLDLSDTELQNLTPQLDTILEFISQLSDVDTKGIPETHQTTGLKNITRKDSIIRCEIEKDLLNCSPRKIKDNCLLVPRVM